MKDTTLKELLRRKAINYAINHELAYDDSYTSAIIFSRLEDNFFPESFLTINSNPEWGKRLTKKHTIVPNVFEMQSSNSSDALLMNVFCNPGIKKWTGIKKLLNIEKIHPKFGVKAKIPLKSGFGDATEIDMVIDDILFEAKLTEKDFTQKEAVILNKYIGFKKNFHAENLPRKEGQYDNYQVIRNLLAAIDMNKRHVFLCDDRRPDLIRKYFKTVSCLKEINHRQLCSVIYWQEIYQFSGGSLRSFLNEKYDIF